MLHAYECYLKARHEYWRLTREALERAVLLLERGLDIVGENAKLYAGLGQAHLQYVNAAIAIDADGPLERAEACARKCEALAPEMAYTHLLRGGIAWFRGDWRTAFPSLLEATRRAPNDPDALIYAGCVAAYLGHTKAGRRMLERCVDVDPLTPVGWVCLGMLEMMDGRFEESAVLTKRALDMGASPVSAIWHAVALAYLGRTAEAVAVIEVTPAGAGFQDALLGLIRAGLERDRERVLSIAGSAPKELMTRFGIWALWTAEALAQVGAIDEALVWVNDAIDRGFTNHPFLAEWDPLLEPLRGEPRFEELIARAEREWREYAS